MSVWAQAWAYEQRTGAAGAKAVLVALAQFADEEGFCYPSQERIADMTEQAVRTVRLQMVALEAGGFIRRERRRNADGSYKSDGFWLLAPPERLRPNQRQILPQADSASGRKLQDHRQKTVEPPAKNGRTSGRFCQALKDEPSYEPSEEPSKRTISASAGARVEVAPRARVGARALRPAPTIFCPANPVLPPDQLEADAAAVGATPEEYKAVLPAWADRRANSRPVGDWRPDARAFYRSWRDLEPKGPKGVESARASPNLSPYVVPPEELTPVEQAWEKASEEERKVGWKPFVESFQREEVETWRAS